MPDRVECSACEERYDSDEHAVCPRCGSSRPGEAPPLPVLPAAGAGARRRLQMGGVILLVMGTLSLLQGVLLVAAPGMVAGAATDLIADQEGGELVVVVTDGRGPVEGADVQVHSLNGTRMASGATDADGRFNATLEASAVARVEVAWTGGTWERTVVVMPGTTREVRVDAGSAPRVAQADGAGDGAGDDWVGMEEIHSALRMLGGFFAFISLFVVLGGAAALRMRGRVVALGGALVGFVPLLVIFVAAPVLGSFLLFMVMASAAALVWSGRRAFRS